MSAVPKARPRPFSIPGLGGLGGGVTLEMASTAELEVCLARDLRWLHGGQSKDENHEPVEVAGFLTARGFEDLDSFLGKADPNSNDYRAVRRAADRIEAIEEELRKRAEQAAAQASENRKAALAKLAAWCEGRPERAAAFRAAAEQAIVDWALIQPIAEALARLQAMFPNPHGALPEVYARLRLQDREIDEVVDPLNGEYEPPPALPIGLPTFEDVRRASNILRTTSWVDSAAPKTGLEQMSLARMLAQVRGE